MDCSSDNGLGWYDYVVPEIRTGVIPSPTASTLIAR